MLTREELLGRATALIPALQERASSTEELRQIPTETIEDLRDAGLLRVANPKRFGGYGYDIDLMCEIAMELGRACGSTSWCYSVWLMHNWMVGHWPEQAQTEYFATGPDTLSSSGFGPPGKLEAATGGFVLNGRWNFSSGSDAGKWAIFAANGADGMAFVLVPRSDYEIVDNWFAAGLKGTGSKDIVATGAFVPAHRVVTFSDLAMPRFATARFGAGVEGPSVPATRGWAQHGQPSYRLPMMNVLSHAISSPLIGMARGAVEAFAASIKARSGLGRTAESSAVQMRFAEAGAEADAGRLIALHNLKELLARGAAGEVLSDEEQSRYQRNRIFGGNLCLQAIDRLYRGSSASSVYASDALQRFFRDAHAAAHHNALNWDAVLEQYGRLSLNS